MNFRRQVILDVRGANGGGNTRAAALREAWLAFLRSGGQAGHPLSLAAIGALATAVGLLRVFYSGGVAE